MARKTQANAADETKGRLGLLTLIISGLCFAGSMTFFLSAGPVVIGMDVGANKETWGWVLMLFSMFLAVTGLSLAVTMSSR